MAHLNEKGCGQRDRKMLHGVSGIFTWLIPMDTSCLSRIRYDMRHEWPGDGRKHFLET